MSLINYHIKILSVDCLECKACLTLLLAAVACLVLVLFSHVYMMRLAFPS